MTTTLVSVDPPIDEESTRQELYEHIESCHLTINTMFEEQTRLRSRYFQMLRLLHKILGWAERSSITALNNLFRRRLVMWAQEDLNFDLWDELDKLIKEDE